MFVLQGLFNALVGYQLSASYLFVRSMGGYGLTIGLLGLLLLGIVVSAYYPAFVLSSFRPILVLKGRFSASKKGIALRKALVIGQFGITVALMIGSFVVYRQIRFMNRQELGDEYQPGAGDQCAGAYQRRFDICGERKWILR